MGKPVVNIMQANVLSLTTETQGAAMADDKCDSDPLKSLREKLAAKRAVIEQKKLEKDAILNTVRESFAMRDEIAALEKSEQELEAEIARMRAQVDRFQKCVGFGCDEVFLPKKAGNSFCDNCQKSNNRHRDVPASVARNTAPILVHSTHSVRTDSPNEAEIIVPCAGEGCGKPHVRSPKYQGDKSYCFNCRNAYRDKQNAAKAAMTKPAEASNDPKKVIKKEVEKVIRNDMPTPDWLAHQVEISGGKVMIIAKITNHPDLPNHPEFFHRFPREVKSSPSKH